MLNLNFEAKHSWSVPTVTVTLTDCADLNGALTRAILAKEREILTSGSPTRVAGLENGLTTHWMEYNVLNWPFQEVKQLTAIILQGARKFIAMVGDPDDPAYEIVGISCWANILRPDSHSKFIIMIRAL